MDVIAMKKNNLQFLNSPNYSFIFSFENEYNHKTTINWLHHNWTWSIYLSFAYLVLILSLRKFMSTRSALNTKPGLIVWNTILAIFSTLGAARSLPEFVYGIKEIGLHHSICDTSYLTQNRITAFWAFAFIMSKAPELGDTLFIVLRKQNLTFLHTAHHSITLVSSWFVYKDYVGISRWFITMNYSVHTVMYSYFALRAMNVKLPKAISMAITTAQVTQMIIGFYVSLYASTMYYKGQQCDITRNAAITSVVVYLFYFYLFGKFFIDSYVVNKKTGRPIKEKRN